MSGHHQASSDDHTRGRGAPHTLGKALLVLAALVAGACGAEVLPSDGNGTVVGVVDGDTVVVDLGDTTETVRLLGIDTPETVHPDRPPECFGAEASRRLAGLLPPGTPVVVTGDVEARDRYGRLLGYLAMADGRSVNRMLVEEGYAAALHIDPNDGMRHELAAAEARARSTHLGLWLACGGPHEPLVPTGG